MKRLLLMAWAIHFSVCCQAVAQPSGGAAAPDLPVDKRTVLALYATANETYEKWRADPKNVKILDVRTPEEYLFVGHPEMAWHVPLLLQTHQWDAARKRLIMRPNPDFVSEVKRIVKPTDTLMVICRSGGRSASAANLLAKAGLKNVYTVTDGMEGDKVEDPQNVFNGKRMVHGWKNSGLPWTYDLAPERMFLPGK